MAKAAQAEMAEGRFSFYLLIRRPGVGPKCESPVIAGGYTPGRPGQSPTQAPHGPLRAQFAHKVLQVRDLLHNKGALPVQQVRDIDGAAPGSAPSRWVDDDCDARATSAMLS